MHNHTHTHKDSVVTTADPSVTATPIKTIFRADVSEDMDARARRAVHAFMRLQPQLSAFAEMMIGEPVRVVMHNGTPCTDGKTIWMRPPIELGDHRVHDKFYCNKRDSNQQMMCEACGAHEDILVTLFHEVGHIVHDSFEKSHPDDIKDMLELALSEARARPGGKRAGLITRKIENYIAENGPPKSYIEMASLVSPFLPMLLNALEDARVNRRIHLARPGTEVMFRNRSERLFAKGWTHKSGLHVLWKEQPRNAQALIALFVMASGYESKGWFGDDVEESIIADEELRRLCVTATSGSTRECYRMTFPILERLRGLGFCKAPDDEPDEKPEPEPEQEEDEPEPEPEDDAEADDTDTRGNDDETGEPEPDDEVEQDDEDSDADDDEGAGDAIEEECDDSEPADEGQPGDEPGDVPDEADDEEPGGMGVPEDDQEPVDEPVEGDADGDEESDEQSDQEVDEDSDTEADDVDGGESTDTDGSGEPDEGEEEGADGFGDDPHDEPADESDADEPGDYEEGDVDPENDNYGDSEADDGEEWEPGDETGDDYDEAGDGDTEAGAGVPEDDAPESEPEEEPEPDYTEEQYEEDGTAEEAEDIFSVFSGHTTPSDDEDEDGHSHNAHSADENQEKNAVDRALLQKDHFDSPSGTILGVYVHGDRHPPIMDTGGGVRGPRVGYNLEGTYQANFWKEQAPDTIPQSVLSAPLMRMRIAFSDNRKGGRQRQLKSGRVDKRSLTSVATGNTKVFARRTMPELKDYFVVIALDNSGSTAGGDNLTLIKQAGMAQAELCARLGIRFAVYFHNGHFSDTAGVEDGEYMGVHDAPMHLDIIEIKAPNEQWGKSHRERLMRVGPGGANFDGHAMEFYRKALDQDDASGKILMYYTDGAMPMENYDEELVILKRELKTMARRGYIVTGVGVHTDSPTQHGLKTVEVNDLSDTMKVVKELEGRITG